VQASAHDSTVKSDLQKLDDKFKLFNLDHEGSFPETAGELATLGLKFNTGSYFTGDLANVYLCVNDDASEYAVVAKSQSGRRFFVESERGISEYSGSVVWDASTGNWAATCTSIDSTYVPAAGNITGMTESTWAVWTGVTVITNLVTNPAFSVDNSGWSTMGYGTGGVGTTERESSIGVDGGYAMRAEWTTAATGSGHSSVLTSPVTITSGTTYTASCYARANEDISTARMRVVAGGTTYESNDTLLVADEYKRLSLTFTATTNGTTAAVHCRLSNLAGTSNGFRFDTTHFMLTEGDALYEYADGDSPGWAWNGTAGLSTSTGAGSL
jgi:hypothetical protein